MSQAPTRNAYIESFNGTFRDECLDENWFESLEQARQIIAIWRTDYNEDQTAQQLWANAAGDAANRQLTGDSKQQSKTNAGVINLANPGLLEFGLVRVWGQVRLDLPMVVFSPKVSIIKLLVLTVASD